MLKTSTTQNETCGENREFFFTDFVYSKKHKHNLNERNHNMGDLVGIYVFIRILNKIMKEWEVERPGNIWTQGSSICGILQMNNYKQLIEVIIVISMKKQNNHEKVW